MLTDFRNALRRFAAPLAAVAMVSVLFGAASVAAAPVSQPEPPERPSCSENCEQVFERRKAACERMPEGDRRDACMTRAQEALDKCLERCENGAGPARARRAAGAAQLRGALHGQGRARSPLLRALRRRG